ncbi:MAG TPA: hypothetical protein VEY07_07630 [Thermoplasmata archaeon]|nr:hypothetical protein [Thermoplasmata archaeon]
MATVSEPTGSTEPLRTRSSERATPARRVRPIGRMRVPLAGPYCPWATLYRFPDGRLLWRIRLWEVDGPVRRLVPTATLLAYARSSGLRQLERGIDDLMARARGSR